jgi:hypothetical protein
VDPRGGGGSFGVIAFGSVDISHLGFPFLKYRVHFGSQHSHISAITPRVTPARPLLERTEVSGVDWHPLCDEVAQML